MQVKTNKKYVVIGGQYKAVIYGYSDNLKGAKIIATKNKEYWDNWQGWRTPEIYEVKNCEVNEVPVATYNSNKKRWENTTD